MSPSLNHLVAQTLESVCYETNTIEWIFIFSGGIALQVSAPWRVVSKGRIALGWQDDGQAFGLGEPLNAKGRLDALLVGRRVDATSLNPCGDLVIDFQGSSTLEAFNASCGYEGWQLFGPGNRFVVAQGGGNIAESGDDG